MGKNSFGIETSFIVVTTNRVLPGALFLVDGTRVMGKIVI